MGVSILRTVFSCVPALSGTLAHHVVTPIVAFLAEQAWTDTVLPYLTYTHVKCAICTPKTEWAVPLSRSHQTSTTRQDLHSNSSHVPSHLSRGKLQKHSLFTHSSCLPDPMMHCISDSFSGSQPLTGEAAAQNHRRTSASNANGWWSHDKDP